MGASIAVNEDSQHILAAFHNGFMHWGGLPKHVYLDNGKALRAKLFHDWKKHDLSGELGGVFPRLGICVTFAQAYNARAKVIERFFLTFQEQFERFVTSFRGSMRKAIKLLHTIEQVAKAKNLGEISVTDLC